MIYLLISCKVKIYTKHSRIQKIELENTRIQFQTRARGHVGTQIVRMKIDNVNVGLSITHNKRTDTAMDTQACMYIYLCGRHRERKTVNKKRISNRKPSNSQVTMLGQCSQSMN